MANKDLAADVREAFMSYDTDVAAIHIMECDGCAGGCSESAEVMLRFARRLLSRERLGEEQIHNEFMRGNLAIRLARKENELSKKHITWDQSTCANVAVALWMQDRIFGPVEECGTCGGEKVVDSGGQNPDGSWIDIACPDCGPAEDGEGE